MPKMKCAKCSGSGRTWKQFLFFRWRSKCAYCSGSGQINMFELPKRQHRNFGLRQTPPDQKLPGFLNRPTVSLDEPISLPPKTLSEKTTANIMRGLEEALLLPAQPEAKQPGNHGIH